MWQFPLNAIAPCSWTPEESQVESCEHQDNANIHCQPFPESVSEEREIYTDYDGCHRHHVKHDSYLSAHFSYLRRPDRMPPQPPRECGAESPGRTHPEPDRAAPR